MGSNSGSGQKVSISHQALIVETEVAYLGGWQEMRGIQRPQVSTLKFMHGGESLLGGTADGVM
jgi:hypothetical protein